MGNKLKLSLVSDFKILYEISKLRRKIIRAEIPFYEMVSTA